MVALLAAAQPSSAPARTKTIVKYGAIALGAKALYNMGQRNAYRNAGYGYYGHGYGYAPYQPMSYGCRPSYSFHYGYSR